MMAMSSSFDKRKLVQRLKQRGNVVAVTGDGTNDAPALHEADTGLSKGSAGTEVAKESSGIRRTERNTVRSPLSQKGVKRDEGKGAGLCRDPKVATVQEPDGSKGGSHQTGGATYDLHDRSGDLPNDNVSLQEDGSSNPKRQRGKETSQQPGRRGVQNGMGFNLKGFLGGVIASILSLFPISEARPLPARERFLQAESSKDPMWNYVVGATCAILAVIIAFIALIDQCILKPRRERKQRESERKSLRNVGQQLGTALSTLEIIAGDEKNC